QGHAGQGALRPEAFAGWCDVLGAERRYAGWRADSDAPHCAELDRWGGRIARRTTALAAKPAENREVSRSAIEQRRLASHIAVERRSPAFIHIHGGGWAAVRFDRVADCHPPGVE